MPFKYLVCLDFEATCWSEGSKENAEIIEIGAVLLNTQTGNIESQFHHYVRPTLVPDLSTFCINLTGITQTTVDQAPPFPDVFVKFQKWIKKIQTKKELRFTTPTEMRATADGPNVTFCTWGDKDLKFYFKRDCQRAGVDISPHFKAWIDGHVIYNRKYSDGWCRFVDALKRANIIITGRAHSGINDANNLAKLMMHLIKNGIQCRKATSMYH